MLKRLHGIIFLLVGPKLFSKLIRQIWYWYYLLWWLVRKLCIWMMFKWTGLCYMTTRNLWMNSRTRVLMVSKLWAAILVQRVWIPRLCCVLNILDSPSYIRKWPQKMLTCTNHACHRRWLSGDILALLLNIVCGLLTASMSILPLTELWQ